MPAAISRRLRCGLRRVLERFAARGLGRVELGRVRRERRGQLALEAAGLPTAARPSQSELVRNPTPQAGIGPLLAPF